MSKNSLFLIDANAFCYRAFYAIKNLATSSGQPTNAVYGFTNMLNKILKEKKPKYLAVCFDVSRKTFRQKKFSDYKIQRPPMPEDLLSQIPIIKEVISAYRITIFEKDGYEADDIIATINKKAKKEGLDVTIVSSDKDILQLVDKETKVFSPYKDEGVTYDAKKVVARYQVSPRDIPDIIALMGDDADNIPGVAGIGEKTAVSLIKDFGSLDKMLKNIDKIKQEKLKNAIRDNLDKIRLSRELAVLDDNVDLSFEIDKLEVSEPDYKELTRIFKNLEFKSFLKDLPSQDEGPLPEEKEVSSDLNRLNSLLKIKDELILAGQDAKYFYFYCENEVFKAPAKNKETKIILSNPAVKKIGHDLKKIKTTLAKSNIMLEGLYFDTMVAAYLLNPSKSGYELNEVVWDYLGKSIKPEALDALKTVSYIKELRPKLGRELQDKKLSSLFKDIEMPLVSVLADMEITGIKIDLKLLAGVSRDCEKKLTTLIKEIYGLSGCEFNINSPKQLREVLFEKLELPVVKRTKTGPSTDEEVLKKLAAKHNLPALLLEYRQLVKIKTTYVDALPQLIDSRTGRLHSSFNQTVTETGRLSSSSPNLQNLPIKTELGRNIRKAVVAFEKDSFILSCDYSQIELRVLAHISEDENLISAFKNNKDVHRMTAALIYEEDEQNINEDMRNTAKRINFGIIYGLSSYGLSRDLGIDLAQAQSFIDAYFLRYPKVKDYTLKQIEEARGRGFVTTISGRRRYLPEINNKNMAMRQIAERQAINTPVQGSASDLIKMTMVGISKEIKKKNLRSKMILQVHDELVFDVPEQERDNFISLARERMENVLELKVPIKVDMKMGKNWLEMEVVK
ncbi:MAG: DNA polymerase I [Candidatus Omnitrophota bacterium]|nr:MAG: DNA polymerase I [Candidatus Omnitrophota bacterium]